MKKKMQMCQANQFNCQSPDIPYFFTWSIIIVCWCETKPVTIHSCIISDNDDIVQIKFNVKTKIDQNCTKPLEVKNSFKTHFIVFCQWNLPIELTVKHFQSVYVFHWTSHDDIPYMDAPHTSCFSSSKCLSAIFISLAEIWISYYCSFPCIRNTNRPMFCVVNKCRLLGLRLK